MRLPTTQAFPIDALECMKDKPEYCIVKGNVVSKWNTRYYDQKKEEEGTYVRWLGVRLHQMEGDVTPSFVQRGHFLFR